ncbi:universal stress protein [Thiolapillus brandeum]|uniref:UspA domain-containing protein n=1 Tax=Thiolapillus brandeum TaxID=1076588 RepID=A0A7U6GJT5_9GAMM|nr:universal stress protein [Thiolapillus brandeum]BAO44908.1 conserved hypothetical protein [Thiolapillus brandeum]
MKKVLVPMDLSPVSEEALRYAVDCACANTRQLILVHVVDYLDIGSLGLVGLADREQELREEMVKEAQQGLEKLARKYAREGLIFKTRIVFDRPWRGIINVAIEEAVDAIVMGSHGRGKVAESLLGSVAGRVVHEAPVPVTIIRPKKMRERLINHWRHRGRE